MVNALTEVNEFNRGELVNVAEMNHCTCSLGETTLRSKLFKMPSTKDIRRFSSLI